mgnify:CR=1 FL=1
MLCRHCNLKPINRPRRLCWNCYYAQGIRELYPSSIKYCRQGVGVGLWAVPLPPTPTRNRPGPGKVAVLEERARCGCALWHPDDGEAA